MEEDRLVQLALTRGCVTTKQIERAKAEQQTLADRGVDHGLYFLLQDLGFLSESDARDLRRSVSSSAIRALEVDGFIIQGRLGSGGMGDVFRSAHPDGRIAAVKLLSGKLAKSEEYVRRFLREGRAMQRLNHQHIVGVFGSGESLGTHYILMELVEGPSLKSWLVDKGKLQPAQAAVVLRQMAEALGYAWDHSVLHRDVKPANILIGPPRPGHDEPFCSKLCDFGLARLGPDSNDADLSRGGLTGSGLALGTPHYMSPEQASGEPDVDQRADIYGLGASIYHALLGQTLYSGKSSAVIMYKQVTENVDLDLLRGVGVSEPLVSLVGSMLQKRRSARISSWAEVLALSQTLTPSKSLSAPVVKPDAETGSASKPGQAARPRSLVRLALITAALVALVVAAWVGLLLSRSGALAVDPAGFPAALAAVGAGGEGHRTITLLPGTYIGTVRLGAAHRGLRLRAAGPGVELVGQAGPAVMCEPGLSDARIEGVALGGSAGVALETVGASDLQLTDVRLDGGVVVGGGTVTAKRVTIGGRVRVGERGTLDLSASRVSGPLTVERADLRLAGCMLIGRLSVRSGSVTIEGVRVQAIESPAVQFDQVQGTIADLLIAGQAVGLEVRNSALTEVSGLTISGPGPSIVWTGERQTGWRWERFSLSAPPRGLPGVVPAGPGADPARLP